MTLSRYNLGESFLASTDWRNAKRTSLAGDASNRKYDRIHKLDLPPVVLMDAPPDKGEDIRPFITIARHLRSAGLSAPIIYAEDVTHGFLLIEDLGDDLFSRVLAYDPSQEQELYTAAVDALIVTQKATPPALDTYDTDAMTTTALLLPDWYLKYGSEAEVHTSVRAEYRKLIHDLLAQHVTTTDPVLVQRDYHAENLLWLPDRTGPARVGLLDFQDAMLGHPAYDLASLLKDARRDVHPEVQRDTLDYYISKTSADPTTFKAAYAVCSAQRNLRILGVFTRLCVRDGKTHYPDLMPRVWGNLMDDLSHPALSDLRDFITTHAPVPDAQFIANIKAATHA